MKLRYLPSHFVPENFLANNKILLFFLLVILLINTPFSGSAQMSTEEEKPKIPFKDRVFIGGGLALSFGSYTYVGVSPVIGYRVTPRLTSGIGGSYYYWRDNYYNYETSIYGGLLFSRFDVYKGLYVEGDFEANNLDAYQVDYLGVVTLDRRWVPSLLLGGGYAAPLGGNSAVFISVLYDVLQDPNSPYYGIPVIRAGVGFGL